MKIVRTGTPQQNKPAALRDVEDSTSRSAALCIFMGSQRKI